MSATTSPDPLAWSPVDAARRLGISRATLYELLATGQITGLKVGSRRLITDTECRRFLAARQAAEAAEAAEW